MSEGPKISAVAPTGDFYISVTKDGNIKKASVLGKMFTHLAVSKPSGAGGVYSNQAALEKLAEKTIVGTESQLAHFWAEAVTKRGAQEVYAKIHERVNPDARSTLLAIPEVRDVLAEGFASLGRPDSIPYLMREVQDAPINFRNAVLDSILSKATALTREQKLAIRAEFYNPLESLVAELTEPDDRWSLAANEALVQKIPHLVKLLAQAEIRQYASQKHPLTLLLAHERLDMDEMPRNLRECILEELCEPQFLGVSSPWEIDALARNFGYKSEKIQRMLVDREPERPREVVQCIVLLDRLCGDLNYLVGFDELRRDYQKKLSDEIEKFLGGIEKAGNGLRYLQENEVMIDPLIMMYEMCDETAKKRLAGALSKGSSVEEFTLFMRQSGVPTEGLLEASLRQARKVS